MKVNLRQAREFLDKHFRVDPFTAEQAGEGAWSQCFSFREGEKDFVIRFGPYDGDFRKDALASKFASPELPIPTVLEIGRALDGWYAISTRVRGVPLESLDSAGWLAFIPRIVDALEAMRLADVSSTHGYGSWNGDGNAPFNNWAGHLLSVKEDDPDKRTHGWRDKLAINTESQSIFTKGLDLLEHLERSVSPRSLIHADLINRNVLVSGMGISGIFDWGCSLYGDHLYDLAWFEFWAPWYPDFNVDTLRVALEEKWRAVGYVPLDKDIRLTACHLHIGLDHLAYNAFTENQAALKQTAERLQSLGIGL